MNCMDCKQSLSSHLLRQPLNLATQEHLKSCSDCRVLWERQQRLEPWLSAWQPPTLSRDLVQSVRLQLQPHAFPAPLSRAKMVRARGGRSTEWLAPGATLTALGLMVVCVFQPFLPSFTRQPGVPSTPQSWNSAWVDLLASVQADYAIFSASSLAASHPAHGPIAFLRPGSDADRTDDGFSLSWIASSPTKPAAHSRSPVAGETASSQAASPRPDRDYPVTPTTQNSSTRAIKSSFQSAFGFLGNSLPEPIDTAG